MAIVAIIVLAFVLSKSRLGREVEPIGFSEGAAFLSGISTPLVIIGVFVVAGMCYGLGAAMLTGFSGKAFQDKGCVCLMPAIAAVVLGGTRITGGRGHLLAVLIRILIATYINIGGTS